MEKPTCPNCPYCATETGIQKAGTNHGRSQRFKCEACQRYFTPHPKPMGYDPQLQEQAVRLYLEGMSFRGIGKVLRVNHGSVINWVNAHHEQLPATVQDTESTETVELDELFTFIGKKGEILHSGWSSQREQVSGGNRVLDERSWEHMQGLADELPSAQRYCSDALSVYSELLWPHGSSHIISIHKEETYTIESLNADFRTYLGRLKRRSRCFSRCIEALMRAVRLFVWHYNRRRRVILANPKYRSGLPLLF